MLSGSISSRLQQFQHQATGRRRDDLSQLKSERVSLGYSGQTTHTRIPARKGLAADLINKFNQLSAMPSEGTVNAVHSPARTHSSENSIQKLLVSTLELCKERETGLSVQQYKQKQQPLHFPSPSPPSLASTDARLSSAEACKANNQMQEEAIIVDAETTWPTVAVTAAKATSATFTSENDAFSQETESPSGSTRAQTRKSPFLSDSELDRALSEIHEFSRDMNISLFDYDSI
ncbi:hypothetical protein J3B02_003591 [Coemansia erecta]|uniref:Uncharacterized protein n=1 Tax=Coemansia asiatica TaxID=1052880 RepID=A0A9W7XR45_9FUNG|nr:hypothetical protein LPJ64_000856 [Coemansia asiatica]KAJ2851150.1 hypothetical protein J3B02_003591 [Coemansia erecta]KAJ2881434.1 hypothetical protein FB639_002617 [Coemansia asiatica]